MSRKRPPEGTSSIGRLHRAEGDPVRNKNWCIYYNKESKRCIKRSITCPGSSQCKYYIADQNHRTSPIVKVIRSEVKTINRPLVKNFEGIKIVEDTLLCIPPEIIANYKSYSRAIKECEEKIKKNGMIEPPITVSCKGTYYYIEDGVCRFIAAQNLGYKKIPIEIGTKEFNKFKRQFRVGVKVKYGSYGEGIIVEKNNNLIKIKFATQEAVFDLNIALKSNSIKLI